MNKYTLFILAIVLGLGLGSGTMYFLLSDEGKWGNPEFMPEFYGGTLMMGVMGVAIGVLAVKSYPLSLGQSKRESYGWLCLVHWGSMALWVVGVMALGSFLGLVNKENGAFIIFLVAFLDGLYTIWMDRDYGAEAHQSGGAN